MEIYTCITSRSIYMGYKVLKKTSYTKLNKKYFKKKKKQASAFLLKQDIVARSNVFWK